MGNGMAIDLQHLHNEIERLREKGIHIGPDNLKISDRAVVTMPYHVDLDCYEEERLGKNSYGSTRRGIAPVYSDKYAKKAVRTGDLLHEKYLQKVLPDILAYKNLIIEKAYNKPGTELEAAMEYLRMYGEEFREYICDTGAYLYEANKAGKRIMFEYNCCLRANRRRRSRIKAGYSCWYYEGIFYLRRSRSVYGRNGR